jgi:glycolate oxidase iron-sulfur subunit
MNTPDSADAALAEADHCVKCGLCLPHCPTFRLYQSENESPRGRIALAEALLRGQLRPDTALHGHIDRCLLCRACETHCPSGVAYTRIIDAARAALGPPGGLAARIDHPLFSAAGRLARGLRLPGRLGRLARALPDGAPPREGIHPPAGPSRGRIGLLLGCTTRQQQGDALRATVTLLNHLGYTVEIPPGQGCCGALATHQGDKATAAAQEAANRRAFDGLETLVSIASACSLQLTERLPELRPRDIVTFLAEVLPEHGLRFAPPDGPVAVHLPCSLHNGLGASDDLTRLLGVLPGEAPTVLGNPGDCCGAGGAQLLSQREQAERLRAPLLEQLQELRPRYLLTANIGCALHLAEGALAQGLAIEVLHPVTLLARLAADQP